MKKDDIVTMAIEDISSEGLGVGRAEGMALFVKDTIIGDVAKVKIMKMKKNYGFARLMELVEPSKDRIAPKCPVARQCGGCQIQEMSYEAQLKFKAEKVRNNLVRIGKFEQPEMEPIIGMPEPFRFRNKAQFPVGTDKNGKIIAGFYAGRTHAIIECEDCLIGAEINKDILNIVLAHARKYQIAPYQEETGKGVLRHVMIRTGFTSGQIMVCLIANANHYPHAEELVQELVKIEGMTSISFNSNKEKTNVIMGRKLEVLWGSDHIEDTIGDVRFHISPLSFYQVNPRQTEKLYGKALEYAALTGNETVWDVYCGIGTISLFLAKSAKQVYGVEIIPEAIQDAKKNAELNDITNAEFFVGKAEEVLPEFYEKQSRAGAKADLQDAQMLHPDVIVVDPPRKGCEESVLQTMVEMAPKRIVYVSCDSATLARDLKILCEKGYQLVKACPVDMFGNSVHVETVALLELHM